MNGKERKNREYLSEICLYHRQFQDLAIRRIPCGILSVKEALDDTAEVFVNAPRAMLLYEYRGFINGLIEAQVFWDEFY